jgi:glycosyltransferase involved in cell wall biosynthesis
VHLIGTRKDQWDAARGGLEPSHLSSHIKVHAHGYVEREERLMEIMGRCRVSFYPGSVGLSLLEGMRAGLPTLIAAPPAPHMPEREVFVEGEVGRFFTLKPHAHHNSPHPFEGSDWAERLEELLSDEAWLDEAQAKCFQQSARFSTAMMARQMLALTCPELAEPDEPEEPS